MWNYTLLIIKDETYEELDISEAYGRSKLYGILTGLMLGVFEIIISTAKYYGIE